jgi:4-amino-4-deoxy-L-arabinose transferase-like glycosyltransferase
MITAEKEFPGYFRRAPVIVDLAIVFLLGICINGYLLNQGPLAGTEGHRALTAHQMVTSGQWLLPKLYDQYYLRKPPLHYWILGGLEILTGRSNAFIWRIPSVLAGALLGIFFYWISFRWFGRLAALVAGISCCGLVALWGQNRTAEIDALNTLACVATACLLLDLGYGPVRHRALITLYAGVAFGAAMMLKGPAGIAPIIAALIGPAIFNRDAKSLKRWHPWVALLIGIGLFAWYGIAVWARFRSMGTPPDTSGLEEVSYNFLEERLRNLRQIVLLPATLFLYLLPISLSLLMAFQPETWKRQAESSNWRESDRRMLRALVGTFITSCAITMLTGLAHERYSYVWAPLICPIAGAVAAAWQRGVFTSANEKRASFLLAVSAIIFTGGAMALDAVCMAKFHVGKPIVFATLILAPLVCFYVIRALQRGRYESAGWALALLMTLASPAFAIMGSINRYTHSTYQAATALKDHIPPGTKVTTGNLLMDQPELFYYSGMNVDSYGDNRFLLPAKLPTSRWIVLDDLEFKANLDNPRLRGAINLAPNIGPMCVLAWYSADDAPATSPSPAPR